MQYIRKNMITLGFVWLITSMWIVQNAMGTANVEAGGKLYQAR